MNVPYIRQIIQDRFAKGEVKVFRLPVGTNLEWPDAEYIARLVVESHDGYAVVLRVPIAGYMTRWRDEAVAEAVCDSMAKELREWERNNVDDLAD